MDGGAWWATVHAVAKSWTRLSDFTHSHLLGARYLKKSLSGHQVTVETMELLGEAH